MERKKYVPQLTTPEINDPWYTVEEYGGYSPNILGVPSAWKGSALNNCVGFCWGSFAFNEGNKECKVGCYPGRKSPGDAYKWLEYSKAQGYETGKEPRLGGVLVWSRKGGKGHVANVVKAYPDGSCDTSESGLNTRPSVFTRHYGKDCKRSGYQYLGCIYPKYDFYLEEDNSLKVGDTVKIIGTGNGSSTGKSNTAYGIGYLRKILKIYEGRPYPYQVGTVAGTTGFYKANDLKKIKEG